MKKRFHIPPLDLIPLDDASLNALLADPGVFLRQLGASLKLKDEIVQVAQQSREFQARLACRSPWIAYLAQELDKCEIVGTCSFKGNPTPDGLVEIAYFTFPEFEGGGFATGMAQELLVRAFAESEIKGVIAHTLPGPNNSTAILEKVGLRHVGEITDPESGRVWRWQVGR